MMCRFMVPFGLFSSRVSMTRIISNSDFLISQIENLTKIIQKSTCQFIPSRPSRICTCKSEDKARVHQRPTFVVKIHILHAPSIKFPFKSSSVEDTHDNLPFLENQTLAQRPEFHLAFCSLNARLGAFYTVTQYP